MYLSLAAVVKMFVCAGHTCIARSQKYTGLTQLISSHTHTLSLFVMLTLTWCCVCKQRGLLTLKYRFADYPSWVKLFASRKILSLDWQLSWAQTRTDGARCVFCLYFCVCMCVRAYIERFEVILLMWDNEYPHLFISVLVGTVDCCHQSHNCTL